MKVIIGTAIALGIIVGAAFVAMPAKADPVPPQNIDVRFVIRDDMGGNVGEYLQALSVMKQEHIGVKLDGMCASACTLVTSTDFNVDYCVTKNAKLGIHHPFVIDTAEMEPKLSITTAPAANKIWAEVFYNKYPKWLQSYIDNHGGAPDVNKGAEPGDMLEVPFDELSKHTKVCN